MNKVEAKVMAELCEMVADLIEQVPEETVKVARRLAGSFRKVSSEPTAF